MGCFRGDLIILTVLVDPGNQRKIHPFAVLENISGIKATKRWSYSSVNIRQLLLLADTAKHDDLTFNVQIKLSLICLSDGYIRIS